MRYGLILAGMLYVLTTASSAAAEETPPAATAQVDDAPFAAAGKKTGLVPVSQAHFFALRPQDFRGASHISHADAPRFSAEDAERIPVAAITAHASGRAEILSDEQAQQIISLFDAGQ